MLVLYSSSHIISFPIFSLLTGCTFCLCWWDYCNLCLQVAPLANPIGGLHKVHSHGLSAIPRKQTRSNPLVSHHYACRLQHEYCTRLLQFASMQPKAPDCNVFPNFSIYNACQHDHYVGSHYFRQVKNVWNVPYSDLITRQKRDHFSVCPWHTGISGNWAADSVLMLHMPLRATSQMNTSLPLIRNLILTTASLKGKVHAF